MAKAIDLKGLVRPHLVEVQKRDDNPNVSEFRLQPLERGYGHTLGNAMRRMLLSSLRGAAVWGFRIDGVVHEHQTIEGSSGRRPPDHRKPEESRLAAVGRCRGSGPSHWQVRRGPVTAGDIENGTVRVGEPGHHIFTLEDDRDISVELYVNRSRLRGGGPARRRPRVAGGPRPNGCAVQSSPPRQLRRFRDAWSVSGLRQVDPDGERTTPSRRRSRQLRSRARARTSSTSPASSRTSAPVSFGGMLESGDAARLASLSRRRS